VEKFVLIITTTDKKEDADKIASFLVEKKLAACVQVIGPIESTYRWKGKVEKSREWLCFIKSRENLLSEIEKRLREIHPYEVPEIVALPIIGGYKDYLSWVIKETTG